MGIYADTIAQIKCSGLLADAMIELFGDRINEGVFTTNYAETYNLVDVFRAKLITPSMNDLLKGQVRWKFAINAQQLSDLVDWLSDHKPGDQLTWS